MEITVDIGDDGGVSKIISNDVDEGGVVLFAA
jgi:hypothetical protein